MDEFAGKVVVVTGAARGIGLATAEAFARAGATVVGWDIDAEAGAAGFARLASEGLAVEFRSVDLRHPEALADAAADVTSRPAGVDVLIANAGINVGDQSAVGLWESTLDAVIDVNLKGTVRCVRALAPQMAARRRGCIVTTASVLARDPVAGLGVYAATKAAVVALTRAWARELGPAGVRVNAVAPGFIDTRMNAELPAATRERAIGRTPLGRAGRPEEVARAHLFLASDAASFITGAVIPVDGGLSL